MRGKGFPRDGDCLAAWTVVFLVANSDLLVAVILMMIPIVIVILIIVIVIIAIASPAAVVVAVVIAVVVSLRFNDARVRAGVVLAGKVTRVVVPCVNRRRQARYQRNHEQHLRDTES